MGSGKSSRGPRAGLFCLAVALVLGIGLWAVLQGPDGGSTNRQDLGGEVVAPSLSDVPGPFAGGMVMIPGAPADEVSREQREAEVYSTLEVRVTRKKFPVAGATVTITNSDPEARDHEPQTTKASGRVRFQVRPGAELGVSATLAADRLPVTKAVTALAAGESLKIRMELGSDVPTETTLVRVTGIPDGLPIAGAMVAALQGDPKYARLVGRSVETDARGFAELPYAPGLRYKASALGTTPWSEEAPVDSDHGVDLALVRHARLHGKIDAVASGFFGYSVSAGGSPGLGAQVKTVIVDDLSEHSDEPLNDWDQGSIRQQSRLDHDGHWEIRSIAFGRDAKPMAGVSVWLVGRQASQRIAQGLTVQPGDDLLVVGAEGSPLDASLVFPDGSPHGHAFWGTLKPRDTVAFVPSARQWVLAPGELALAHLPYGEWDLYSGELGADGHEVLIASFEHTSPERRQIVVTGVIAVRGQVQGLQLGARDAARMAVVAGTIRDFCVVGPDGSFELCPMQPGIRGSMTLTVWHHPPLPEMGGPNVKVPEAEVLLEKEFSFIADGKEIHLEY